MAAALLIHAPRADEHGLSLPTAAALGVCATRGRGKTSVELPLLL